MNACEGCKNGRFAKSEQPPEVIRTLQTMQRLNARRESEYRSDPVQDKVSRELPLDNGYILSLHLTCILVAKVTV